MDNRTFRFTDDIYRVLNPKPMSREQETEIIINLLNSDNPCMISRFGSGELQTICLMRYWPLLNIIKNRTFRLIGNNAGFFPVDKEHLKAFYALHKKDTKDMDVLITWRIEELMIKDWLKNKIHISKSTLDDFYSAAHPWTRALKDKRVLVVHPFADTIRRQYETSRSKLFVNEEVLPEFKSLQTIKAVQSIAGNPTGFRTWFEALQWMKDEIDKSEFDIALIGCGAYGLPLAAHVKRIGRKAVHMGGVLQFLFGITGKRYDENDKYKPYINEYFVYPEAADRPKNASAVEGGCYW